MSGAGLLCRLASKLKTALAGAPAPPGPIPAITPEPIPAAQKSAAAPDAGQPVLTPPEPLASWIERFQASDDYRDLAANFADRESSDTPPAETAMLFGIIRHLRPARCLEIGTLFAHTTRIMAEAAVAAATSVRIVTIDPFGAERVPGLLAAWPESLRHVTDFRPLNSMQYFLEEETAGTPKGAVDLNTVPRNRRQQTSVPPGTTPNAT